MDIFVRSNQGHKGPNVVNVRCPACGQNGSFHGYPNVNDLQWARMIPIDGKPDHHNTRPAYAGMRLCPNTSCRALIFVSQYGDDFITYPPEVLDFDATNLPPQVQASLSEAVKCHAAGCHKASALMVRRVLEELCDDKRATGKDLKARISALSSSAVVPPALLQAADELRILGNDAAHVHAKDYDQITANESELAIELAKELLKAVYQYTNLVDRLAKLKKPATT